MHHLKGLSQIRAMHLKYLKKWLEAHQEGTDPVDACKIGMFYHTNGDHRNAFKWLERSANGNNATAQFNLALCYLRGQGTAVGITEATQWFKRAANQGIRDAQRAVKALLVYGPGAVRLMPYLPSSPYAVDIDAVTRDPKDRNGVLLAGIEMVLRAPDSKSPNELIIRSAVQGHPDGQFVLAWWYHFILHNHAKAHEWYSRALKNSHSSSYVHYYFALMYFETHKYDYYMLTMSTAANTLRYTPAQLHLGQNYLSGKYITRDTKQGVYLLQAAAKSMSSEAMYELGTLYRLGDGVQQDLARSFEWYKKASEQSSAESFYWMAVLRGFETTDGRRYLELAAKNGAMLAQNDLGTVLVQEKQFSEAKHWLKKASDRGDRTASDNLQRLQKHVMGRCLPPLPGLDGMPGVMEPRYEELL